MKCIAIDSIDTNDKSLKQWETLGQGLEVFDPVGRNQRKACVNRVRKIMEESRGEKFLFLVHFRCKNNFKIIQEKLHDCISYVMYVREGGCDSDSNNGEAEYYSKRSIPSDRSLGFLKESFEKLCNDLESAEDAKEVRKACGTFDGNQIADFLNILSPFLLCDSLSADILEQKMEQKGEEWKGELIQLLNNEEIDDLKNLVKTQQGETLNGFFSGMKPSIRELARRFL